MRFYFLPLLAVAALVFAFSTKKDVILQSEETGGMASDIAASVFTIPTVIQKSISKPEKNQISEQIQVTDLKEPVKESARELIDNWNLNGTGLTRTELAPYMFGSQPRSIVYYDQNGMKHIYPIRYEEGSLQSEQTLFMGRPEAIRKTAAERDERAATNSATAAEPEVDPKNDKSLKATAKVALAGNSYEIVSFKSGKRDDGSALVPVSESLIGAIQGPDYSLEQFDSRDEKKMRAHLSTVLSMGHGGELILKVKEDGVILDEGGFDFALFENTFRPDEDLPMQQEFAEVGVSDSIDKGSFRWFSCNPRGNVLRGCFGAVPTAEGGDQFDLAEVGLKQIRYIWIKDIGINKNIPSRWPTEGCDLDALRLYHAYTFK